MPTVLLNYVPWGVDVVGLPGELGEGTAYPFKTGLGFTHDIYWNTRRLRIAGFMSVTNENDSVTIQVGGTGDDRKPRSVELLTPTEGLVIASSTNDLETVSGSVTFQFQPESAALVNDYEEQYLLQMVNGGLSTTGTPDPEFDPNIGFSSVRGVSPLVVEIGRCSVSFARNYDFPIYAAVTPGYVMACEFAVTRDPWG